MTLALVYLLCFIIFLFCAAFSLGLTLWYINNESQLDTSIRAKIDEENALMKAGQRLLSPTLSDHVMSIWEVAIFSVIFTISIYILSVHFGIIKDSGKFANNIFGSILSWYLKITTELITDLKFWICVFAFYAVNNLAKVLVSCSIGKKDESPLEWPFSLLAFGIKKSLLLFATTSATFSVIAERFYHDKWSILFIFIVDSTIFIGVLFIPLIDNKGKTYINYIHKPFCAIGRFIAPCIARISRFYGPAK